jgi:hypothetical protein
VGNDPVVIAHARALMAADAAIAVVQADVGEATALLAHPELRKVIDTGQPAGVVAGMMQFFPWMRRGGSSPCAGEPGWNGGNRW